MKRGCCPVCLLAVGAVTLQIFAATDPFLLLQPPVLTNGTVQLQLLGETDVHYVIESAPAAQVWTPVITNSDAASIRWITLPASNGAAFYRAQRQLAPRFPAAIVARQTIALNGNNVRLDSYDSADPAHDDPTDAAEIKAGGDIYCQGDVNAGNSVIHGKVKHGGLLFQGTNGLIGDLTWTNRGSIQPGWAHADYRFVMPEVTAPFTNWMTPTLTSSNTYFLTAGDYKYNGALPLPTNGDRVLVVAGGFVRLWVTGDFMQGQYWSLHALPGATFQLYVGDDPSVSTTSVKAIIGAVDIGDSTDASTFQYYGFPNNVAVDWFGNDVSKGTVYAPQAQFSIGGGGSGLYDFMGACVAHYVVLNGHLNVHYDENLRGVGPQR